MATAATSGWVSTNNLTGTSWVINVPAVAANGRIVLFVAGVAAFGASTPDTFSWTQHKVYYNSTQLTTSAIYSQSFVGAAGATTVTLDWTGSGAQGCAFAIALSDAQFDAVSSEMVDASVLTTERTLGTLAASTNGSMRLELLITSFHRTMVNSVLTDATLSTYTATPNGGIGAGVGYKAASAGTTTGDLWVFTDPDVGAADTPSVGHVIIFKPAVVAANPVISGYAILPVSGTGSGGGGPIVPPASPSTPPTVVVLGPGAVNVTIPPGYDPTADKLHISYALITDGVPGAWQTAKVVDVAGLVQPIFVDGFTLGAVYRFAYYVSRDGVYSEFGSFPTIPITIPTNGISTIPGILSLDIATGEKQFIAQVGGVNTAGVPIASANTAIATVSSSLSGIGGIVTVTPISAGSTNINVGPYGGEAARQLPVTVVDTTAAPTIELVITPAGPVALDIRFGGKTFVVTYDGDPVVGAVVSIDNPLLADVIDLVTDAQGRFRIEPLAVGTAIVTVTVGSGGGEIVWTFGDIVPTVNGNQFAVGTALTTSVTINISDSVPVSGHATTIRMQTMPTIHIGDAPFNLTIGDQVFAPVQSVECDVSLPGYLSIAKDSKTGVFKAYPRGVGKGKLIFIHHDPVYGRLEVQKRFEVLP